MRGAAYLMTYRQGADARRHDNLQAVLSWLARHPGFDPVLVEQDDAPRLDSALAHPRCRHVFAYNPGPFNKSWGLNVAVRSCAHDWLVFADADIVLGDALPGVLDAFADGAQAVNPYKRIVDLDDEESARVRNGDFNWLPQRASSASGREAIGERIVPAGGVFALTRAAFTVLGGWDERFLGWGGEDDALSYRIERARLPVVELDARPALHLAHQRAPHDTTGHAHYADNCALLQDYRRLEDAQLARMSEIQMQLIGQREKYRPR